MRRRALHNLLSNEEQSLEEVWAWYEFQRALIGEEKSRVLTAPLPARAFMRPAISGRRGKSWTTTSRSI